MSFNNYRIVVKSFNGVENELMRSGQVVNVSGFRNVRGLEEGRYLRPPHSEEDYQLITAFMEQEQNPVPEAEPDIVPDNTETESEQEPETPAPKRGRPPKNGGEE